MRLNVTFATSCRLIMNDEIRVHYTTSLENQYHIPDDRIIIDLCNRAPDVGTTLQLNDQVLVKYRNVTIEECRNQVEARRLLDPKIVVVPEVYRYFSKGTEYYLVMEFVKGTTRCLIEDDESITKIARIVRYLQTHQSNVPGPLGGGRSRGLFWENEEVELRSTSRLEEYLNRRMVGDQKGLCIEVGKLVLNHNDIAPRNIIWMPDGSICLIDWSDAGYYPQLLELAVLRFNTQDGKDLKFTEKLTTELGPLTASEETNLDLWNMAWFNSHRYVM